MQEVEGIRSVSMKTNLTPSFTLTCAKGGRASVDSEPVSSTSLPEGTLKLPSRDITLGKLPKNEQICPERRNSS